MNSRSVSMSLLVTGLILTGTGLVLSLVGGEITPLGTALGLAGPLFSLFGILWLPKPKVLGPMKTAKVRIARMVCSVCDKPLVDNEIVVYQAGEDPIHEACHRAHPDD